MTPDKAAVRERLDEIEDPALGVSIVSLGLLRDIRITPTTITLSLALNAPYAPEERLIVDRVHAELADFDRIIRIQAAADPKPEPSAGCLRGVRNVIGITAGTSGVTKPAVTVNVVRELASRGARVGILNADTAAPAARRLLGVTAEPEVDDTGRLLPPHRDGIKVLDAATVFDLHRSTATSGLLLRRVLAGLLHDVEWRPLDYLFVDLAPGLDEATLEFLETAPILGSVVVTSRDPGAIDETRRCLTTLRDRDLPVLGVAETALTETDCPARETLPRAGTGVELASAVEVPFLESLPIDPCRRSPLLDREPPDEVAAAMAALTDAITNEVGRRRRQAAAHTKHYETDLVPNGKLAKADDSDQIESVQS